MKNLSTLSTALHEANLAAEQKNWFEVQCHLQQLPLNKKLEILDLEISKQALNLALEVLCEGDFQQKWSITKFFPTLGQQVIEPLIAVLEDKTIDPEIHWFAVKILGNFPKSKVIITLANLIQTTEEEDIANIASQTLAHIGKPAIEVLTSLLDLPEYRFFAVCSLARIRTIETIPTLIKASKDRKSDIRAIAIEALGSFHIDPIPELLIMALEDTSSLVRKEAVMALGFRQDIATKLNLIDRLEPLLYDINLNVCSQTAIALGKMRHQQSAKALFQALQSPNTPLNLKLTVVRALGWSEIEISLDYLQQILPKAEKFVCQEIITILGRISQPKLKSQAADILVDFATNYPNKIEEHQLKTVLATSLGELGEAIAKNILRQLEQDSEPKIRLHAIAALKRLG